MIPMCGIDHESLNQQILADEFGSTSIVCLDPALQAQQKKNIFRAFRIEEVIHGILAH